MQRPYEQLCVLSGCSTNQAKEASWDKHVAELDASIIHTVDNHMPFPFSQHACETKHRTLNGFVVASRVGLAEGAAMLQGDFKTGLRYSCNNYCDCFAGAAGWET